MQLNTHVLVFDAPDAVAEAEFWAAVFGGSVASDEEDDWYPIVVDGREQFAVQHAPDLIRSDWPARSVPQQLHLDLHIDDLGAAHDEVTKLGASLLQAADDPTAGSGFQVYASPAGHPFCLCWG
jgi:predicted enzyme related to lactoylglutathione lyase